jgi:hypothetical protein
LIAEALTASNDTQDVLVGGSTRLSAEGRGEEVDVMAYDAMPRSAASRGLKSAARQVGLRPASLARREMMIVSKAYYIEHKSKVEIAEELGVSRFRVARLLAQAEECGVVTHTLNSGGMITELSEAVAHHLNIHHANVLEVYGDVPSVRTAVGRAIGLYMRDIIEDGEVLGIGWGRTLNAMFDDLDERWFLAVVATAPNSSVVDTPALTWRYPGARYSPRIPHDQGDEMANLSRKALSEGHRYRRAGSFNSSLAHRRKVALSRVNSQGHCRSRSLAQHMHNISGAGCALVGRHAQESASRGSRRT